MGFAEVKLNIFRGRLAMTYVTKLTKACQILLTSACISLLSACVPFQISMVVDKKMTERLSVQQPTFNEPLKIFLSTKANLNGKPTPKYQKQYHLAVVEEITKIPNLSMAKKDSEADIRADVVYEIKWDQDDLKNKVRNIMNSPNVTQVSQVNVDIFARISGNGHQWEGPAAHTLYAVLGDVTQAGLDGRIYSGTSSPQGGMINFKELRKGDAMVARDILFYFLDKAKRNGCARSSNPKSPSPQRKD